MSKLIASQTTILTLLFMVTNIILFYPLSYIYFKKNTSSVMFYNSYDKISDKLFLPI